MCSCKNKIKSAPVAKTFLPSKAPAVKFDSGKVRTIASNVRVKKV